MSYLVSFAIFLKYQMGSIAKEQAETIALQERTAKEQAEALLKKYRDRFGDIPE
jgi:hypothetical protein